jgi:hypothetical protein
MVPVLLALKAQIGDWRQALLPHNALCNGEVVEAPCE